MAPARKTALVVSAHSADFVWRAGGAIALYAARGYEITIVCLSFGERGESAKLWRKPGMTLDAVKAARREEAEQAAALLGARLHCLDLGDYPLRVPDEAVLGLADLYREIDPAFVLTHSLNDPYNFDHPRAAHVAQEARIIAQAHGHRPEQGRVLGAPPVFLFEPHQPAPADRLMQRGDAERRQPGREFRGEARFPGDDDAVHASSSVTCGKRR